MLIGRGATTLRKGYKSIIGNAAQDVRVRTATSTWSGAAAAAATAAEPPFAKRPPRPLHRSSVMAASEDGSQSRTHDAGSRQNDAFAKGKSRPWTTKPRSNNNNKRPTHFVCLPLATETSIPQLSESLAYFRSVTTTTTTTTTPTIDGGGARRKATTTEPESNSGTQSRAQQHGTDIETEISGSGNGRRDDTLRLIPPAAHRPPGTFHLTLGAMDLSNPKDLERALKLLEGIDYQALLAEAGKSVGGDNRGVRTTTSPRSLNAEGSAEHSPEPGTDDEGRNDDHHVDEERRDGGSPIKMTRTILVKPLESLSRAISPPPTSKKLDKDDIAAQTSSDPKATKSQQQPGPTTLTVTLHGLGTFPRASSSRVFFAHADEDTGRLLPFGDLVRRRFRDAGLVTETRPLVLHATVANLIYVKATRSKGRGTGGGGGGGGGVTVDARDILRYFNDGKAVEDRAAVRERNPSASTITTPDSSYIWARDIVVDRIRICKMGAEKSELEGWGMEYKPVGEKIFGS